MDTATAETSSLQISSSPIISPEGNSDHRAGGFIYSDGQNNPPDDVENATIDDSVVHLPQQAFQNRRQLIAVRLGAGLQVIGRDCFEGCRELESVEVPESVTEIRSFAFAGCYNLKEVCLKQGLEIIDTGAFVSCIWLKTVKIPWGIHLVRSHAFSFCIRLTTLELPEGLQTIAPKAFRQCISLMTVRIPSTVIIIKVCAFLDCKNLLSVEMAEEGLQRIEARAFQNCEDLRSFYLPSTVARVGEDAFDGCTKLKEALPPDTGAFLECLRHRFRGFPIHKLAYFHSFQNVDTVMDSMNTIFSEQDEEQGPPDTDVFQMCPLHIIALSSKPHVEVALQLVRHYSDYHTMEDAWGRLPVIYLCQSAPPNSLKLVQLVAKVILPAILDTFHLQAWERQIADYIASMDEASDCRARSAQIQRVLRLVEKYRTKEKMCLIEWMMWKKKMGQLSLSSTSTTEEEEEETLERPAKRSRQSTPPQTPLPSHRIQSRTLCGADVVISNVVPFLMATE
mmetsp:Transcript_39234/g.94893  ORF Transcript_39234/g.94893 Transcript_39234/m.94893 type:complete len:508 (-) Transcript_39234:33-1556(-)